MSTTARNDARLNFRLPAELKALIEQAAALGQSVSDFAPCLPWPRRPAP
jgi:uncharacterized protein (DUF1778 family)